MRLMRLGNWHEAKSILNLSQLSSMQKKTGPGKWGGSIRVRPSVLGLYDVRDILKMTS